MTAVGPTYGVVSEDGTFSALARLVGLDGSGGEVCPGEGAVLLAADVSSVACRVYDLGADRDSDAGTEVTPAPTVAAPADVVSDALRTVGWAADDYGYNFRHDVGPAYTADPGEWRLVEYQVTLTGGGVLRVAYRVYTEPTRQS